MSRFKVGDSVESEYFPDVQSIEKISGNAVRVAGQWLLEKQVELVSEQHTWTGTGTKENPMTLQMGGIKHDQDKPDLSLLPREALEAMAQAFMYGANKYGRYNYKAGMEWHRPLAAALRHIVAFTAGEDNDPESGLSHLGHAMAAVAMVTVYQTQNVGKDTRHKP